MTLTDIVETSPSRSNVEWGPILAGAAIATALGLILLAFGAALGLGFSSPYRGDDASPAAFAIAAGLYLLWVQIMSFYFGGYVAARLRARAPDASEHEVDVRDGLHGLLVWSIGVIAAAVIAYAGIGGVTTAARAPAATAGLAASVSQVVDQNVRQSAIRQVQTEPQAANASDAERRAEVARKLSIIGAFITAASLLAGAVAAFFGAHSGGHHRDKNVTWAFFNSRARLPGSW